MYNYNQQTDSKTFSSYYDEIFPTLKLCKRYLTERRNDFVSTTTQSISSFQINLVMQGLFSINYSVFLKYEVTE